MESITGIPADAVGRVVQDFVDDGAEHIVVELTPDGTYTVSRGSD
jgi:hypothetical protein